MGLIVDFELAAKYLGSGFIIKDIKDIHKVEYRIEGYKSPKIILQEFIDNKKLSVKNEFIVDPLTIIQIGDKGCPPCVVYRLMFERLKQIMGDILNYEYIDMKMFGNPDRRSFADIFKEIGEERGLVVKDIKQIPAFFINDYNFPIHIEMIRDWVVKMYQNFYNDTAATNTNGFH